MKEVKEHDVKNQVIDVFDDIAQRKAWEDLYSVDIDSPDIGRTSYNFVTRRRSVMQLLESVIHGEVLDIGCGTGDLASQMAASRIRYQGVDLSQQMIERARILHAEHVQQGWAKFAVADCEALEFADNQFDLVLAVALIEYLPDPARALDEITRVTKPGGYVLITVPYSKSIDAWIRTALSPLIKLLMPIYLKLRRQPLIAMKDVKHYSHDESRLDNLMQPRNMQRVGSTYSNFHLVPFGFDQLIPKFYMRCSEWVHTGEREQRYRLWASNYIALFRKNED